MRRLAPVALLGLLLTTGACQRDEPVEPAPVAQDTSRTIALGGLAFDRTTGTVSGEMRNYKTYPFDSVLVVLDVVSGTQTVLGTYRDSLATVAPGSVWRFSRQLELSGPADSARFIRVTRYAGTPRGQARLDYELGNLVPIPRLAR